MDDRETPATHLVTVWDPLVRISHWSIAVLFGIAMVTEEDWQRLHNWAGYALLALIGVRIVWGFVGSRHARFSDFVRPPSAAVAYLRGLIGGTAPRTLGHNPAGGLMALALWAMLVATGVTGWLVTLQVSAGREWLRELHELLANGTLVLVILHVLGVAASSYRHGENLVMAMLTGRKRADR